MEKHLVYCSRETLVAFADRGDSILSLSTHNTGLELQSYLSWYTLLAKDAELYLDIDKEDYYKLVEKKEVIKFLEKSSQAGGSKIRLTPGMLSEDSLSDYCKEFPSSLYLTEDTVDSLCSKYGRVFLSSSSMIEMGKLIFEDKKFLIDKKAKSNINPNAWHVIRGLSLPLTDIVLIDNYILKNEIVGIWNITELIKNLIPTNQELQEIRVAILTSNYNEPEKEIERKLNVWFSNLNNSFINNLPGLRINLSIGVINSHGLNHDRTLLTNYVWIGSGSGFTVFKQNGTPAAITTITHSTIFHQTSSYFGSASTLDCWLSLRKHAVYLFERAVLVKGEYKSNLLLKEFSDKRNSDHWQAS